jgi:hypothetical protein
MARTNADNPDLSVWVTDFEASFILKGFANASRYFTCINFKGSGFNIDRHNLAVIAFFDLRTHLRFINLKCVGQILLTVEVTEDFGRVASISDPEAHRNDKRCHCFLDGQSIYSRGFICSQIIENWHCKHFSREKDFAKAIALHHMKSRKQGLERRYD